MQNLSLLTRPRCFGDVIGQDLVIEQILSYCHTLRKEPDIQIQPLILAGPRGTGKTTTARLIAKYLNCEKTIEEIDTSVPCICSSCVAIDTDPNTAVDYYELDAASNNKVDDMAEVVEQSFYRPIGRFKIFLLDEGHMLTRNAFNLLLKQFEEPPTRVLYIIATTEEHKIIPTITSRSKIRRFNLLDDTLILKQLSNIVNNPQYIPSEIAPSFSTEVLEYILSLAHGSMRDAIKYISDVLELEDKSLHNIQKATGSGDIKKIGKLLQYLFDDNLGDMLIQLNALEKSGIDPKKLMEQTQKLLVDILNVKIGSDITSELPPTYYKEKFSPKISTTKINETLGALLETEAVSFGSVTYHTLTYAFIKASYNQSIIIPTHQPEVKEPAKTFPKSNYKLDKKPTAADKLAQKLQVVNNKFPKADLPQDIEEEGDF